MFNIGAGELAVILVVALIVLGPQRLPELARGIGKFMREFRRQTDDVRNMVEREFYRMDQEFLETPSKTRPAGVATGDTHEGPYPALSSEAPSAGSADSVATEQHALPEPSAPVGEIKLEQAQPVAIPREGPTAAAGKAEAPAEHEGNNSGAARPGSA